MTSTLKQMLIAVVTTAAILSPSFASDKATVNMLSIETNTPGEKDYWAELESDFESANPDIDVVISYLDDESFKTKLSTLLQSDRKPDIFFSWGGSTFYEQAKSDILEDISEDMKGDWMSVMSPAGVDAFTYDGKIYGAPLYAADAVFWYNKDLLNKAGVNPDEIKTWDDFLVAVQKCKDAGVTPIVAGGKDKWPLQFYYGYLALRIAGKEGIQAAGKGEDDGFMNESFLAAARELDRLAKLEPFQKGYMDTTYDKATGLFGDGRGAFHLMGNWDYGAQRVASSSGKGLSDEQLGFIPFPAIPDGKGAATDTYGGINGWLVSKGASKEAVKWLRFMLTPENQAKGGKGGYWIPMAKGSDVDIENPFMKQISKDLANAGYHQLFFDQALGSSVGNQVNDISADIAQQVITPEEAIEQLQEAWDMQ